jgi:hypothetical protein
MEIVAGKLGDEPMAEWKGEGYLFADANEGTDWAGTLYFGGFQLAIVYLEQVSPAFFDLKNGIAGEVLQKFANYRIRLAMVGDFSAFQSQALQAFIVESNRGRQVHFCASRQLALDWLGG